MKYKMKKRKKKIKIKIKKKTIEEPKYQSEVSKEEHGRQGRVKFWIGDFIDNESTPVETRQGDEVKIVNVIGSMGLVSGNIYDSSYRERQEWTKDGVYLREDWMVSDDPSFDLFFSSTYKNPISSNINLRPHTYDGLCNLYRMYIDRQGVLKKDTKEPFRIMHITQLTGDCYRYSVTLRNCSKDEWVTVSENELLEQYTWPDGKPCGVKRGRQ